MDTTQLYAKNQGLPNNTTALVDLHQEDPVADTTADHETGTTAGHPIEQVLQESQQKSSSQAVQVTPAQ